MDLHEALAQISEIREQVARTETFRGYRAAPVAFSGVLACLAAALQDVLVPAPAANPAFYLAWWVGAALLSMIVTGVAMVIYCRKSTYSLSRTNTILAVGQFLPSVVAGGLVTFVLFRLETSLELLPGLWSIFFSLGILASYRLLPKATFWVGVFYMLAGVLGLIGARGDFAFSPWAMGVPFGAGQLLVSLALRHGDQADELV